MSDVGYATLPIIPSLRGARAAIEGELGGVGSREGERFGDEFSRGVSRKIKLGSIAKGLGVITAGALGIGGAIAAIGVKGSADLETVTTSFTALLGSTKAATDQIAVLQAYAAKTPFSQQDVLGYAQQFYALAGSVGLSKAQVIPFLDAVGNLGAVTGASTENIHNAVMAIGQIGSSGKVTLDNLNQISEAFPGFNGAAAIASATGQTTAQVMKQISAGSLDASTGVRALLTGMQKFGGAAGAMDKQSQTLKGVWSTFTDTLSIATTKAFQPLIPTIKATLGQLTPIIASTLGTLAPTIATFVKQLAPIMGPLVQGLGRILGAVFQALGPILKALTPIIQPLVTAIVALVQAVSPLLTMFAQIIGQLGPPLLQMFTMVAQAIMPVAQSLAQALAPVLPIIAQAISDVMVALQPLITALSGAFIQVIRAIAPDLPIIARAFADMARAIARMLVALMPLIEPLTKLATILAKWAGGLLILVAKAIELIADGIALLARGITNLVRDGVPALETAFSYLTGSVHGVRAELGKTAGGFNEFGATGVNVANQIGAAVNTAASAIANGVTQSIAQMIGAAVQAQSIASQIAGGVLDSSASVLQIAGGVSYTPPAAPSSSFVPAGGFSSGGGGAGSGSSGSSARAAAADRARAALEAAKKRQAAKNALAADFNGFYRGIGGTYDDAVAGFVKMIDDARAAGLGNAMTRRLKAENKTLAVEVSKRNGIAARLKNAQAALAAAQTKYNDERSSVKGAFTGAFNIATAGTGFDGQQPVTASNILAQVRQAVTRTKKFLTLLKALKAKGLPAVLLDQLAQAGPDALPEAQALANATSGELAGIKSGYAGLNSAADQVGKFMADGMYGAGVNSAKGLIAGLQSQEAAMNKAISNLAGSMVAQLKRSLGIHSPSIVMRGLGSYGGQGFALGLTDELGNVKGSAASLADAAIPNLGNAARKGAAAPSTSADPALVEAVVTSVMAQLPQRFGFEFDKREVARMTAKADAYVTRGR